MSPRFQAAAWRSRMLSKVARSGRAQPDNTRLKTKPANQVGSILSTLLCLPGTPIGSQAPWLVRSGHCEQRAIKQRRSRNKHTTSPESLLTTSKKNQSQNCHRNPISRTKSLPEHVNCQRSEDAPHADSRSHRNRTNHPAFMLSIKMSAISGRVNSTGGL